jgi:hypothetical protein
MAEKKEAIQELINKDINDLLSFKDIPAIDVTEMVKFNGESHSLILQVTQAVVQEVDSQSKCDALNLGLSKVNKIKNVIEGCRKEKKSPIIEAGKQLDAQYKKITEPLTAIVQQGNKQVRKWDDKVEADRRELQRKLDEENRLAEEKARKEEERRRKISKAQGGTGENITPVPEPEKKAITAAPLEMTRSTSYSTRWKVEITDPTKVPETVLRDPKVIDAMRMVAQRVIDAQKRDMGKDAKLEGLRPIPGVKVNEVKDIRR